MREEEKEEEEEEGTDLFEASDGVVVVATGVDDVLVLRVLGDDLEDAVGADEDEGQRASRMVRRVEPRPTAPARPTTAARSTSRHDTARSIAELLDLPGTRERERAPHSPGCTLVLEEGRRDLVVVVGGATLTPGLVGMVECALGDTAPRPD